MAKLVLTLEGKVIGQYFIDKPDVSIGRDPECDVPINDPLLSMVHAHTHAHTRTGLQGTNQHTPFFQQRLPGSVTFAAIIPNGHDRKPAN